MKYVYSVFALLFISSAAIAGDGFSCEKIKEKSVRVECIKDRTLKERAAAEEATRIKSAQEEKAEATSYIENLLNDPDSAQFRNVRLADGEMEMAWRMVCGEVNGKNSFGGYVGFTPFVYSSFMKNGLIIDSGAFSQWHRRPPIFAETGDAVSDAIGRAFANILLKGCR